MTDRDDAGVLLLSAMTELPVKMSAPDVGDGVCHDALVDLARSRVTHLLLDVTRDGVVSRGLYPTNGIFARDRLLLVTEESRPLEVEMEEAEPVGRVSRWPSLLTGPFGNTISPAMILAQANARLAQEADVVPPGVGGRSRCWASELRGLPVFDGTAELGRASDLVMETGGFSISRLLIGAGAEMTEVEIGRVRRIAADGSHISLIDKDFSRLLAGQAPSLTERGGV